MKTEIVLRIRPPRLSAVGDVTAGARDLPADSESVIMQTPADIKDHSITIRPLPHPTDTERTRAPKRATERQTFDCVYGIRSTQEEVYSGIAPRIIPRIVDGFNVTVMAYGQTGSGKTYTVQGPPACRHGVDIDGAAMDAHAPCEDSGLLPRIAHDLFTHFKHSSANTLVGVTMSYVQVYKERVYDLLPEREYGIEAVVDGAGAAAVAAYSQHRVETRKVRSATHTPRGSHTPLYFAGGTPRPEYHQGHRRGNSTTSSDKKKKPKKKESNNDSKNHSFPEQQHHQESTQPDDDARVEVRERVIRDSVTGKRVPQVFLSDCNSFDVSSPRDIMRLLTLGHRRKAIAGTDMNETSSRSHSLLFLDVVQQDESNGDRIESRLTVVDLAGSEHVNQTGATGQTFEEATHVNRSLTTLSMVIRALSEKQHHVPYRSSVLTRILTDSLGGNSQLLFILAVAPEFTSSRSTLSTVRFGARVKRIENRVRKNRVLTTAGAQMRIAKLEAYIQELEEEIATLRGTRGGSDELADDIHIPDVQAPFPPIGSVAHARRESGDDQHDLPPLEFCTPRGSIFVSTENPEYRPQLPMLQQVSELSNKPVLRGSKTILVCGPSTAFCVEPVVLEDDSTYSSSSGLSFDDTSSEEEDG